MIKLNDQLIEFGSFGNGETSLDGGVIQEHMSFFGQNNQILFKYESDKDLIELMLLKKALDDMGSKESDLVISYMPYSRADREEGHSLFTLKHISDYINYLGFTRVFVHEPHSDVTLGTLDRSIRLDTTESLFENVRKKTDFDKDKDYVFYPDAGAQKRFSKLGDFKELIAFKKRNFDTQQIESFQVVGDFEKGSRIFIIDDITAKGDTFLLSAEKLKELGAGEIFLVVTHTENQIFKGKIPDSPLITKVYTTDTIIGKSLHEKVEILMTVGWGPEKEIQPQNLLAQSE